MSLINTEIIEDDVLVADRPKVTFNIGDEVKLIPGATYASGGKIPDILFNTKLFVRQIKNGNYSIGINTVGKISGSVKPEALVPYTKEIIADGFEPYLILIKEDNLAIKSRPDHASKTLKTLGFNGLFTVVGEKDGWGHLKIGGWIPLDKVTKLAK